MLKNIIFISNSIPKSGSTLLFNLQRDFLNSLCGKQNCDYSILEKNEISHVKGFVSANNLNNFLLKFSNILEFEGPLVLKTHAPIGPVLRKIYESDRRIFISTIIRDPLDITLSAIENHSKTGEFQQFSTLESACKTVNNFFQSIYDTTIAVNSKPIPVVRYENLIKNPVQCLKSSFHPKLIDIIIQQTILANINIQQSSLKARHRLQRGGLKRDLDIFPIDKHEYLLDSLKDFRFKLNYLESKDHI